MILPRGVTGFGNFSGPAVDFAEFKSACYLAARRLGGSVLAVESCQGKVTPNFHEATLSLQAGRVEVLCNARFPLAAATRPTTASPRGGY